MLDLTGIAGVSAGSGSEDMRVAVRDADEELVLPLSDARALVCTEAPMAEAETALGAPEVGTRIEVYWTGMRAWYLGRVLPLQEEDEEGSTAQQRDCWSGRGRSELRRWAERGRLRQSETTSGDGGHGGVASGRGGGSGGRR